MKATWRYFVSCAQALRYPTVVDVDGVTIVGIPGGYMAPTTNGPTGPRVHVANDDGYVDHDLPVRQDVEAFLKRVAPR